MVVFMISALLNQIKKCVSSSRIFSMIFMLILFIQMPACCHPSLFSTSIEQNGNMEQPFNAFAPIKYNINFPSELNQYNVQIKYGPDYNDKNINVIIKRAVTTNMRSGSFSFDLNFDISEVRKGEFNTWMLHDSNQVVWDRAWYEVKIEKNINKEESFTENRVAFPILIKPSSKPLPIDDDLPSVELISPLDGNNSYVNEIIIFNYIPKDDNGIKNCTLYIDDEIVSTSNENLANYVQNSLTYSFERPGSYNWSINCYDNALQSNASEIRNIIIDALAADPREDIFNVEIVSPKNGSIIHVNRPTKFEYVVNSNLNITECTLNIHGKNNGMSNLILDETPVYDQINYIDYTFNHPDEYLCNLSCYYGLPEYKSSQNINLIVSSPSVAHVRSCDPPEVEYYSINDAIRSVSPGGKIFVNAGDYKEHVDIDKPLQLIGLDNPVIYGTDEHDYAIRISSSDVVVKGFVIEGNNISGIIAKTNDESLYNITINDNVINHAGIYGISLAGSGRSRINNITINGNQINGCSEVGIYLYNCNLGHVTNNKINCNSRVTSNWGINRAYSNDIRILNNVCCRTRACFN